MSVQTLDLKFNTSVYYRIRNWNDKDYFYISADIEKKFVVPTNVVNGNETIVICLEFEPFSIVEKIYNEIVLEIGINPKRILLLSENYDLKNEIVEISKKYNTDLIQYEYLATHHLVLKNDILRNNIYVKFKNIKPKSKSSDKIFLNFNRRWRFHRPLLVILLFAKKLLDKGYVSLAEIENHNFENVYPQLIELVGTDQELVDLCLRSKNEICNIGNLFLDTTDLESPQTLIKHDETTLSNYQNFYQETLVSLVTETLFFENNGRFISEKTFKPIIHNHPFIILGSPYTLEMIKEQGFKTFHPYINEDYDSEVDPIKRLRLILIELEKLCSLDDNGINQFLSDIESTTNHNFKIFFEKKNFTTKMI